MMCKVLKVFYVYFTLISFFKRNSLKSVFLHPHKFHTDNAVGF